uniref:Uncharacterized protein n=1 Tax=viral metagenome TaxID=1070528 RepID=A0A6M3XKN4_9ZZZZ
MAGTVTITYSTPGAHIKWAKWAWTSDASGDVSGTDTKSLDGKALSWVTNPDGTDVPTTLYDIVVNDADGADVAAAGLANRSATAGEKVNADPPQAFNGALSLVVAAAGNAKKGTLTMYYEGRAQP